MIEKPKVKWDEDSETYTIEVAGYKIFIEYDATETFDWFHSEDPENAIHEDKIVQEGGGNYDREMQQERML